GDRPWSFDGEPKGDLQDVHTPDLPGIDEVGKFMKVKPKNMLKTLVFAAGGKAGVKWVICVVRGDHDVNESKAKQAAAEKFGVSELELVDSPEVRQQWAIGFVGPHALVGRTEAVMLVDPDAAQGDAFWATGANEVDHHVKYFNWRRELGAALEDASKLSVADIRN